MVEQTRLVSAIEAAMNTLSGFVLSWLSFMYLVGPVLEMYSFSLTAADVALYVTLFYTALSLARSYVVRRFFARNMHVAAIELAKRLGG